MTNMLPKEEALQLTDREKLEAQIQMRHRLRSQMVGSLYPGILMDEIRELQAHLKSLPPPTPW